MTKTVKTNVVEQVKGETTMETQEKEFNNFMYVKNCILKEYVKDTSRKEFSFMIKAFYKNSFVISYLNKVGALKVSGVDIIEAVNPETGEMKKVYQVSIKDFDINAKGVSKKNNEFRVFDYEALGRAFATTLA